MSIWNNLIWRAAKILSGHPKDPAIAAMFGGGSMSSAGIDVNEKNALQSSAVYACIRVLAETVAHVPLIMYRRTDKGRMRAVDHPSMLKMLDRGEITPKTTVVEAKRVVRLFKDERYSGGLETAPTAAPVGSRADGAAVALMDFDAAELSPVVRAALDSWLLG